MRIENILNTNKIIGVIGNSGSGKSSIISKIKNDKKIGIINSNVVKCDNVKDQIEYYVKVPTEEISSLSTPFEQYNSINEEVEKVRLSAKKI